MRRPPPRYLTAPLPPFALLRHILEPWSGEPHRRATQALLGRYWKTLGDPSQGLQAAREILSSAELVACDCKGRLLCSRRLLTSPHLTLTPCRQNDAIVPCQVNENDTMTRKSMARRTKCVVSFAAEARDDTILQSPMTLKSCDYKSASFIR